MARAIGMIEFKTVSAGITAADQMVKTSDVELLEAQTVCPGKYIALIAGDLSAVKAAVERAKQTRPDEMIDSFVLGNPDPSIFPAIWFNESDSSASANISIIIKCSVISPSVKLFVFHALYNGLCLETRLSIERNIFLPSTV